MYNDQILILKKKFGVELRDKFALFSFVEALFLLMYIYTILSEWSYKNYIILNTMSKLDRERVTAPTFMAKLDQSKLERKIMVQQHTFYISSLQCRSVF